MPTPVNRRPRKYKCPVCQKPLTKKEFERAFKIHEAQQEHVEAQRRQLAEDERKFEAHKKDVTRQAREKERTRTRRIVGNKDRKIGELRETIKLLKRGKTPQEYGPEFEAKLVKRLRAEFAGDDIRHEGRAGDVFHIVRDGGKVAGSIIYECKWTPRISGSHVQQAAKARMSRHAEFAVLVTSGTKRGFTGLDEMYGVLIVSPAGVLVLAGLLRNHLIEMFRAGIEKGQRAKIANQLLKFIKGPEFKNPIEEVVHTAERLKLGIEEECRWHVNDWKKRLTAYDRIRWDGWAVQENLRRVLRGEAPKQLAQPKPKLALLASTALSGELSAGKAGTAKAGP
jgi:hypothetical protein